MSEENKVPQQGAGADQSKAPQFEMVRSMLKDTSLETPNLTDLLFNKLPGEPKMNIEMIGSHRAINAEQGLYEVVLRITATLKEPKADKVIYICEVNQAGIFLIRNFDANTMRFLLEGACLNYIHPYAAEAVNMLTSKTGLPGLMLRPANFEMAYRAKLMREAQEARAKQAAAAATASDPDA